MVPGAKKTSRRVGPFLRDESGSFTIETVMWLPVLVFLFCMIADASLMFGKQAQVMRVVQDANRALSVGRLQSDAEVEAYIAQQIAWMTTNAVIATDVTNGVISSTVSIPAGDMTATGFISAFSSLTVSVTAQHLSEA